MNADTQRLIDRLHKSARNAANAKNAAQREAAIGFLVKRADELRAVRDELHEKLWGRCDWHDAHDPRCPYDDGQHSEQFIKREDRTVAMIEEYTAICEALDVALIEWLHDGEEAA